MPVGAWTVLAILVVALVFCISLIVSIDRDRTRTAFELTKHKEQFILVKGFHSDYGYFVIFSMDRGDTWFALERVYEQQKIKYHIVGYADKIYPGIISRRELIEQLRRSFGIGWLTPDKVSNEDAARLSELAFGPPKDRESQPGDDYYIVEHGPMGPTSGASEESMVIDPEAMGVVSADRVKTVVAQPTAKLVDSPLQPRVSYADDEGLAPDAELRRQHMSEDLPDLQPGTPRGPLTEEHGR